MVSTMHMALLMPYGDCIYIFVYFPFFFDTSFCCGRACACACAYACVRAPNGRSFCKLQHHTSVHNTVLPTHTRLLTSHPRSWQSAGFSAAPPLHIYADSPHPKVASRHPGRDWLAGVMDEWTQPAGRSSKECLLQPNLASEG